MSINISETNSNSIINNLNIITNSINNSNLNIIINRNYIGTFSNIINNSSLNTLSLSNTLIVSNYGPNTQFYYEDSNNGETSGLTIEVSIDEINWETYITFFPIDNYNSSKRVYSTTLNLNGIISIRIRNLSTNTLSGIYCYILS